jgi:hypothetical protein
MEVLNLTVYLSLLLAAAFLTAFVRMALRRDSGGVEQEALLPLAGDHGFVPQKQPPPAGRAASHDLGHDIH